VHGQITNVSPIDGRIVSSNVFDVRQVLVLPAKKDHLKSKIARLGRITCEQPGLLAGSRKEGHLHSQDATEVHNDCRPSVASPSRPCSKVGLFLDHTSRDQPKR